MQQVNKLYRTTTTCNKALADWLYVLKTMKKLGRST